MSAKTTQHLITTMLPITIPIIGVWGIINIYKHYKSRKKIQTRLQHINQYENQGFIISNGAQIINRYNQIPINNHYDYTNKELLRPYMKELERKLGNDIRIAHYNFSTLRIEYDKNIIKTGVDGTYNGTDNLIKYAHNNSSVLGHEVLHMASYMYDPTIDTHYHGFMQQKGNAIIGTGLNEGYTELMNSRLFNDGKVTSYPRLVRIVKLLEEFFPNPQIVAHYYFNCNLPAFLQNLKRYCTQEELKEILYGLDRLYEYNNIPDSPLAIILETQIASKLYNIYQRNFGAEPAKLKDFQKKAGENKLTCMALAGNKMRITRTNQFNRIKNDIQTGFRKIKNFFRGVQTYPQPSYSR